MEILAILTALVVSVFLSFVILELIINLITNRKTREIKRLLSRLSNRISECSSILESTNRDKDQCYNDIVQATKTLDMCKDDYTDINDKLSVIAKELDEKQ